MLSFKIPKLLSEIKLQKEVKREKAVSVKTGFHFLKKKDFGGLTRPPNYKFVFIFKNVVANSFKISS